MSIAHVSLSFDRDVNPLCGQCTSGLRQQPRCRSSLNMVSMSINAKLITAREAVEGPDPSRKQVVRLMVELSRLVEALVNLSNSGCAW